MRPDGEPSNEPAHVPRHPDRRPPRRTARRGRAAGGEGVPHRIPCGARNPGVESSFPRGLLDLGYVEGRDVVIEWRDAGGHNDRLLALAADLIGRGVDVIVAAGPEAREAARKATTTIPIVVVGSSDPVAEGWAESLGGPTGNVPGPTR